MALAPCEFTKEALKDLNSGKPLSRQEANRQIMVMLRTLIERYPDWRFGQILVNLNIVVPQEDPFFPESTEILARAMASFGDL